MTTKATALPLTLQQVIARCAQLIADARHDAPHLETDEEIAQLAWVHEIEMTETELEAKGVSDTGAGWRVYVVSVL